MLTRKMQAKKARYIKEKARKEVGACYEDIMQHNKVARKIISGTY